MAGDDTCLEDHSWDAVLVAALAEPKARIFESLRRILSAQNRRVPIIYRTYTGRFLWPVWDLTTRNRSLRWPS